MKKPNIIIELLKIVGAFILGSLLWLIIFSAAAPADAEEIEPFRGAIAILGILTGVVVSMGLKYNSMHRAYQRTKSQLSNIRILEERSASLLDKANRVADKYMNYEGNVQTRIAHERSTKVSGIKSRISNASQFQSALENYPDLKANENIMELLRQIQDCENLIASQKTSYNETVENYNVMIHSFPSNILSKIFHFKDAEFYKEKNDDIISDEALGI